MKINDAYIAYCLDEAIAEFIVRRGKGEKPRFKVKKENKSKSFNPGLNILTHKK